MRPWKLPDLKQVTARWEKDLEGRGWNSLYLGNHDQPRAVSRFGDDGRYRAFEAGTYRVERYRHALAFSGVPAAGPGV